jgi:O-antigen/teichoic acid export membrane protein
LIGILSTLRYEMAIILPDDNTKSVSIIFLSGFINIIISILCFLILFFFDNFIINIIKIRQLSFLKFIIPIFVFLIGMNQILNYWSIRIKKFKILSISKFTQSAVGSGTNILFGFLNFSSFGLIIGSFLGQFISTTILFFQNIKGIIKYIPYISKNKIFEQAKIYKDFPRINLLQSFIDVLKGSLVIFVISYFYNAQILGLYAFTLRLLKTPVSMIGSSVSNVFFQKASEIKNKNGNIQILVKQIILKLLIISIPFFLILVFFSPILFALFFGDQWKEAGVYTQILSPWLLLNFIISPISQVPIIMNKQKTFFKISLIGNSLIILPIIISGLLKIDILYGMIILSFSLTIFMLVLLKWIYKISGEKTDYEEIIL